jgi:hypothetical protein
MATNHRHTPGTAEPFSLSLRALSTVLAALRYWQRKGLHSPGHEHHITTANGTQPPMTAEDIDRLCEELSCADDIHIIKNESQ